ncbi:hypothetical protein BGZ80_002176 [Entomortierella chlamydospora]|uniref:FAD-binding domain-containing protein n=1 Tax=Entomortierella chlamydospora TaxID=101097 RepID=A0A9P6T381_9FUNG|nr:hypothetical protein BGZ80_002176 [Entomortierella chlamydospora]
MSELADDLTLPVLIVGAGLGGLTLGALLENANISYHILERATELRSLGSAIAMMGPIIPAFEQLGIYEELKKVSLPLVSLDYYDTKLNSIGSTYSRNHKMACGYDQLILARPKLYNLLHQQVPAHKISMGKKVIRTRETSGRVIVCCSDDTEYNCSILVGADGTYSVVRQSYITMVGISNPPNPEKYPELSETDRTHFRLVLGDNNDSERINLQLPEDKAKAQQFRNSEWGPESINAMLKEYEDFPCAFGGTMWDLFDATPKNLISKVFLEEKVFQTWHHGRTVLLGDACHKLLPGAGQGAVMAMKDAVVLVNCLYNMRDKSDKSVNTAFASYDRQRFLEAENTTKLSAIITKTLFGHVCVYKIEHAVETDTHRVTPSAH